MYDIHVNITVSVELIQYVYSVEKVKSVQDRLAPACPIQTTVMP